MITIQGVIEGVFKIKGVSSWAITRAEKISVSVFLPNEHPVDDLYTAVCALPTVWSDVSMKQLRASRGILGLLPLFLSAS